MKSIHKQAFLLIVWLILANLFYPMHDVVSWATTLAFFLFVPGLLLTKLLNLPKLGTCYTLVLSLGLSLIYLMGLGLILNSLFGIGVNQPLGTFNIFAALDLTSFILIFLARKRMLNLSFPSVIFLKEELLIICLSTMLPVLAAFGAIRLNNGANDILTLILFAVLVLIFIWLATHQTLHRIYPFSLFCFAVAILFTVSLRGWFVTGSDVQREFYVFQETLINQHWSIGLFRDPYNACMSITILPTMLEKLTRIPPQYIYKVVYQLLLALGTLSTYLFVKKIKKSEIYALFGSFIFMTFPMFLTDMSIVNRQEIAFIFFALIVLVNFTYEFSRRQQTALTLALFLGLILSHYSSAYVAFALMLLAGIAHKLIHRYVLKQEYSERRRPIHSPLILLMTFLITFLWNVQVTNTSQHLSAVVSNTVKTMFGESGSAPLGFNPLGRNTKSPQSLLNNYGQADGSTSTSNLLAAGLTIQPLTKLGSLLSKWGFEMNSFNKLLKLLGVALLAFFMAFGTLLMSLNVLRRKAAQEIYLLCLSFSSLCLLALQAVIPNIGTYYGPERLLQQLLILLMIPILVGIFTIFKKRKRAYLWASLLLSFIFLDLSGFIAQILGGYYPPISLENAGIYYQTYYIHHSEVYSANWLNTHKPEETPVEMDDYARLRFLKQIYGGQLVVKPITGLAPGDYLYQDFSNVTTGIYQAQIGVGDVSYRLTTNPNTQKSLVYTNGGSAIYK